MLQDAKILLLHTKCLIASKGHVLSLESVPVHQERLAAGAMHTQGEHRRRASSKLSVLVARELAAKAGSARKRSKRTPLLPAGNDADAEMEEDCDNDDLADSDAGESAEGAAAKKTASQKAGRGRRLLESDDEENGNNMDGDGSRGSGSAADDRRATKKMAVSNVDDDESEDGSESEHNDAGAGSSAGSGSSESEGGDDNARVAAAASLARDAAAEEHESGSDASDESEEEVQSPPTKKRTKSRRGEQKPAHRSRDADGPAAQASQSEAEAGASAGQEAESDAECRAEPAAVAMTEMIDAEPANRIGPAHDDASILPTEVQEDEDDSGSEEVASGNKPAADAIAVKTGGKSSYAAGRDAVMAEAAGATGAAAAPDPAAPSAVTPPAPDDGAHEASEYPGGRPAMHPSRVRAQAADWCLLFPDLAGLGLGDHLCVRAAKMPLVTGHRSWRVRLMYHLGASRRGARGPDQRGERPARGGEPAVQGHERRGEGGADVQPLHRARQQRLDGSLQPRCGASVVTCHCRTYLAPTHVLLWHLTICRSTATGC